MKNLGIAAAVITVVILLYWMWNKKQPVQPPALQSTPGSSAAPAPATASLLTTANGEPLTIPAPVNINVNGSTVATGLVQNSLVAAAPAANGSKGASPNVSTPSAGTATDPTSPGITGSSKSLLSTFTNNGAAKTGTGGGGSGTGGSKTNTTVTVQPPSTSGASKGSTGTTTTVHTATPNPPVTNVNAINKHPTQTAA